MAYFKSRRTKKIELPSNKDYWVEIIDDLTYGELKQLGTVDADNNVDFATTADKFLLVAITAWNLDDEEGNVLEINQESIDELQKEDVILILQQANAMVDENESLKATSSKQ